MGKTEKKSFRVWLSITTETSIKVEANDRNEAWEIAPDMITVPELVTEVNGLHKKLRLRVEPYEVEDEDG